MPDRDLPWAAMLKLAGVRVEEVAEATGRKPRYVYKQLHGDKALQYDVRKACVKLLQQTRQEWLPAVRGLLRVVAGKSEG